MSLPTLAARRLATLAALAAAVALTAAPLRAQADAPREAAPARRPAGSLRAFAAGFASSILAHEGGHIVASLASGARPSFGFDRGRPTVYSGIDYDAPRGQQLAFSTAGLAVQTLWDELILDIPHERGSAFERGVLAGGIGTTLFYATIGRTGTVSDVEHIARLTGLSKTELTLILTGVAALHTVRIAVSEHYADFFVLPGRTGELRLGISLR